MRLVPSGRSLLSAFAILAGALLLWVAARETGVFGVRTIAVQGAPGYVAAQVEHALRDARGESLVALDVDEARRAVKALPTVAAATLDRGYPHTLRVAVVPERPAALVRQGATAILVSARGRVITKVERSARPALPRIWVPKSTRLAAGETVAGDLAVAVGAVAPVAETRFPARITSVVLAEQALTLRLRSGLELRLGSPNDARLKLAVAARVLPLVRPGSTYLDVSVPERPVAGSGSLDPQVEGES
ncbi:MAG: cell division protein FtsQ/DivIB [Gaiella sp.]